MKLLLKREQSQKSIGRIAFKLWCKIEPEEEEQNLIDKYQFHNAVLTGEFQEGLFKQTAMMSAGVWLVVTLAVSIMANMQVGAFIGLIAAVGFGYWWINEKRDVIMVKDLLHGRNFKCDGVIDLAKQEAELEGMSNILRQVLEGCKHWDGTETINIDPLPKEQAKQLIQSL